MNIFDKQFWQKRPLVLTSNVNGNKIILVADAMEDFNLEQGLEITEHPVEDGVSITDHARVKLKRVNITFIVTEAPLTVYSGVPSLGLGVIAGAIGGTAGAVVAGLGAKLTDNLLGVGEGRVIEAKKKLDDMVKEKQIISLTVKNHTVNNLMIEAMSYPDSVNIGKGLLVVITLKEIRTVENLLDKLNIDSSVRNSATPSVNKGVKQVEAVL